MTEVALATDFEKHRLPHDIVLVWDWVPKSEISRGSMRNINDWATVLILQDSHQIQRSDRLNSVLLKRWSTRDFVSLPMTEKELIDLMRVRDEHIARQLLSWMTKKTTCISDPVPMGIAHNYLERVVVHILDQDLNEVQVAKSVLRLSCVISRR